MNLLYKMKKLFRKKKNVLSFSFDLPMFHESFMKHIGKSNGEMIPHRRLVEVHLDKKEPFRLLAGKADGFYFIARGDEMVEHILKENYVPAYSHPAFLTRLFDEKVMQRRIGRMELSDQKTRSESAWQQSKHSI